MTNSAVLEQAYHDFTVSTEQLSCLIDLFCRDMAEGLAGRPSSLAMLPSFLSKPSGQEKGIFLALDFGGTNARALLVKLLGNGRHILLDRRDAPLVDPAGRYNHSSAAATAEELFDFLAAQLASLVQTDQHYLLGHTFSFPFRLEKADTAVLLHWTKEFATIGVVGKNVVALLRAALCRQGLHNIQPAAIANDTVTTLVAAAYQDALADIGSICGTGHNTCYLEPYSTAPHYQPSYINIESGNFDKIPLNAYDRSLDENSDRPGAGLLEKCCSGRYIGELFRLCLLDLTNNRAILPALPAELSLPPYSLTGRDLALLLGDATPALTGIADWLVPLNCPHSSYEDRRSLKKIATLISRRSARLAAATYTAILRHIDPGFTRPHVIAIDGSLYEKLPGYAAAITETLHELLGEASGNIHCRLTKDASGIGAAVAAATTLPLTPRPR